MYRNFNVSLFFAPKEQIQKSVKTAMDDSFRNFEKVSQGWPNLRLMFFKFLKKLKLKKYSPLQRKSIRGLKANMCMLLAFGLIVAGVFFYIWPKTRLVTLIYNYNNLRQKEKNLTHYNRMLRLELASFKSLGKVERIAIEKMGMIVPEDKNIILVNPLGTGASRLR